jgi:colanic acid/amylovoran biosynthesis glycosyltransferase
MNRITYIPESFPQPSETFVINEISGLLEYGYDITVVPRISGAVGTVTHSKLRNILKSIKVIIEDKKIDFAALLLALKYGGQVKRGVKPKALIEKIKNSINIARHVYTIKAQHPEIIIIHFGYDNAVAGIIAATQLKIPAILWLHGSDMYTVPHKSLKWLTDKSSNVVTHSKFAVNLLRKLGVQKSIDISCLGVDINKFKPAINKTKNKKLVLICVARLGHNKNHKKLIQVFRNVSKQMPNVALWLIGDGQYRTDLEKLVTDYQLGNVIFWGALGQEKIVELLQQASIKVLLSEKEGFPVVLMESQAIGLPSIATLVGGVAEVVTHEETGFLFDLNVPNFDTQVTNSIVDLLKNDGLREQMGKASRLRAEKLFDENVHINFMHNLIAKNLDDKDDF